VLEFGRETQVVYQVRKDSIAVRVDGKPLFTWTGDLANINISGQRYWVMPNASRLGVGGYLTEYRYSQIDLLPLSPPAPEASLPELQPGDWLVMLADGTTLAARPVEEQILQLADGRAVEVDRVTSYQAQGPGKYMLRTDADDVAMLDESAMGELRMASRFGQLIVPLDEVTVLEPVRTSDE
jgi:hypothetical protein